MSSQLTLSRSDKFKRLIAKIIEGKHELVELTLTDEGYVCVVTTIAKFETFKIGHGWIVTLPRSSVVWTNNLEFKCVALDGRKTLFAEVSQDSVRFYYRK